MQSLQEFLENYDEPYKLSVSKNIQQGSPRISNFIKDKVFDISQKILPLAFSNLLNARDAQEAGLLKNPFYMYNIHEKVE